MGYIVLGVKNGFIVNCSVIAVCTILGLAIITAITPFVSAPRVVILLLRLTPGVITAVFLGSRCANIAGSPLQAAGQAKVNIFGAVDRRCCFTILATATRK